MNIRKVTAADLHLGMPMPWNVYGENGDLMVRKGHMLASVSQISSLVAQGVYEDYSGQAACPLRPCANSMPPASSWPFCCP
jgi:hypothetical protein